MTDLKKVLEEHVLDSHVTLSLRELFGIRKKEFMVRSWTLKEKKAKVRWGRREAIRSKRKIHNDGRG